MMFILGGQVEGFGSEGVDERVDIGFEVAMTHH